MKSHSFSKRLLFALAGWREAFNAEKSFRTQCLAAAMAIAATAVIAPAVHWWAIITLTIALVLATELLNTALEQTLDGLHPQHAEFVRKAKDSAAGAVLVFSVAALLIFGLMIYDALLRR